MTVAAVKHVRDMPRFEVLQPPFSSLQHTAEYIRTKHDILLTQRAREYVAEQQFMLLVDHVLSMHLAYATSNWWKGKQTRDRSIGDRSRRRAAHLAKKR
jgi:hypothetical protein